MSRRPLLARALPDWPRRRFSVIAGTGSAREWRSAARDLVRGAPRDGEVIERYEHAFARSTGCRHAFAFGAGRMGLYALLEAAGLGEGDEVVLPGYTCVVVPNALVYRGVRPVYADIDGRTFNVDARAVEAAITPRTRAVVLQHTFGVTADVEGVRAVADRHGLLVVEDAAHSLGASRGGRPHGALGDVAYFSTDRTKVISSQLGGVVTTNDDALAGRLGEVRARTPFPSAGVARRILLTYLLERVLYHPSAYWLGRPAAAVLSRLGLLFAFRDELAASRPTEHAWPCRFTAGQAGLGLAQLERLPANVAHRRRIAAWLEERIGWYAGAPIGAFEEQAWLRYSFLVRDRAELERRLRRRFDLGVWFTSPIFGRTEDLEVVGYRPGSCPVGEAAARNVVNFPTHSRVDLPTLAREVERLEPWLLEQLITPEEALATG